MNTQGYLLGTGMSIFAPFSTLSCDHGPAMLSFSRAAGIHRAQDIGIRDQANGTRELARVRCVSLLVVQMAATRAAAAEYDVALYLRCCRS